MLNRWVCALLAAATFLLTSEAAGQVSREEFEALKAEIETLKEQLQDLTDLTRAGRARGSAAPDGFKGAVVTVAGGAIHGKQDARVTIVEFSDYQCVFCGRHSRDTFPQIDREYIQTGRVRYVVRDFPIESIHPQAFKAHEAAHCAGEQGKHWAMHEKLFSNQRAMSASDLTAHAQSLGLEMPRFEKCLASGQYAPRIRQSFEEGRRLGVRATPTFFIGLAEPNNSTVKALQRVIGAQPYSAFKAAIDQVLSAWNPRPQGDRQRSYRLLPLSPAS
jgi:protein-disulfide isomerase